MEIHFNSRCSISHARGIITDVFLLVEDSGYVYFNRIAGGSYHCGYEGTRRIFYADIQEIIYFPADAKA